MCPKKKNLSKLILDFAVAHACINYNVGYMSGYLGGYLGVELSKYMYTVYVYRWLNVSSSVFFSGCAPDILKGCGPIWMKLGE